MNLCLYSGFYGFKDDYMKIMMKMEKKMKKCKEKNNRCWWCTLRYNKPALSKASF